MGPKGEKNDYPVILAAIIRRLPIWPATAGCRLSYRTILSIIVSYHHFFKGQCHASSFFFSVTQQPHFEHRFSLLSVKNSHPLHILNRLSCSSLLTGLKPDFTAWPVAVIVFLSCWVAGGIFDLLCLHLNRQ